MTTAPPPSSTAQTARVILTRLQEIMAARASAQSKLNRLVKLIGASLDSEVCSLYLLREGVLELFATHGLKQAAVHVTRLALGEGLVGTIVANMETLNLDEAATHPDFAFRAETGEEKFHSFAGVPIIHREEAVGALCVQHVEPRRYDDIEIETLQTVAMVVSELIAGAGLVDRQYSAATAAAHREPIRLGGQKFVGGMGRGVAVFHQPQVTIEHTIAEDIEAERHRVYAAFDKMREQIEHLVNLPEFAVGGDHEEVLKTYRMFAYDEGWSRRINAAIDRGLTAEAAIENVQQHTRMRMQQIDDPLLRERMHDLEDLANRLLRIVSGQLGTAAQIGLRQDSILIARNLGPAELLEYDRKRLQGVLLEEGSLTAHVVIVARAMRVPVLGRVVGLHSNLREGDEILLDATASYADIRPSPRTRKAFEAKLEISRKRRASLERMCDLPAVSKDQHAIELMINAGLREHVNELDTTNACGIGLFRTEFQFLVSATLPRREKQKQFYSEILDIAGERPVVFRTVDVGGDKALPYMRAAQYPEENPAMGWRALRVALERDGLFKVQARALIEAAAGRTLHVMFPMVAEAWEYRAARQIFREQYAWLAKLGKPLPDAIFYGVMLEVPSLAETLDTLVDDLDFISIGTNDLVQFLFAADRAHPRLAERYDSLSPPVLRFLARVVKQLRIANVPVSVCGEMSGNPLEAMALLGLGIDRLSLNPASIAPVKAMLRSLDIAAIRADMPAMLANAAKRADYHTWAQNHKVDLGE